MFSNGVGQSWATTDFTFTVFDSDGVTIKCVGDAGLTAEEAVALRMAGRLVLAVNARGGCGACVVLLSKYDPVSDQVKEFSVSSCLTLLCSINFCSVTTTEGLGNTKDGYHSIHQRFSGFHATQCGFCTPGMCMSLFSALTNADKTDGPEPPIGFSKITKFEAQKSISGNLCRCTGYRPIADVCKSFAADVDLEDLGLNTFWKKPEDANVDRLPPHNQGQICTFPEFLKSEITSSMGALESCQDSGLPECQWYRPSGLEQLYKLLNSDEFTENQVKLVMGNTGSGVYKENDLYDKYIDLTGIPELSVVKRDSKGITLGAAVTISRVIEVLKEKDNTVLHFGGKLIFCKIVDHMDKVASPFIRNMASLGGNLIMAQRNQFASDIATILLAVGSIVCFQTSSGRLIISLEEFLKLPPCDDRTILISIHIPYWSSDIDSSSATSNAMVSVPKSDSSILFETYRAAPRPLGNAVSYLNSAFLVHVISDKISGDLILLNLHLAFGAYGSEHAIRARKVEEFLTGKILTASILLGVIHLLKETIIPKVGTRHSRYRASLAITFLFNFFQPLAKELVVAEKINHVDVSSVATHYPNDKTNGSEDIMEPRTSKFEQLCNPSIILSSKQLVEFSTDYDPIGAPIKKVGAEIQASEGITFKSTQASPKVIAYIGASDIPTRGENIGCRFVFGAEPLFADSLTEYVGQCLGVVVAETQRYANMAAKQANVHYSNEELEPPILSIEDAIARSSFFDVPPAMYPKQIGDLAKGMDEADHKILSAELKLGSQYYFYMETQTALAIPDEDNYIVVYSSTQFPEHTQGVIAKCLGVPEHNVRVITRRVGGGFGGKALRSMVIAAACALAAFTLHRPVRMYLDRKTDMIMIGGRHPMKINYSVGFKSDGKITALHMDLFINAGITIDLSPLIPSAVITALEKYNWGALSFNIKLCKTNLTSKSAMRAPGDVQGSYIAEAIIEHVAAFLSMDTDY
ncbi:hypothetical protein ZIOFF_004634 [Zingiber officinale]|uniref:FAD-binding PCMH-type domain-containing protein n=1 Tax=Zingiber officinale TaxID=94328 RepID=A0A8J5HQ64_ZINOF|nr:hypothetical protein ZIOFF_004634 [Zingiber officinale]